MATTSERLREAMQLRGMRQSDLSTATGIGKSSISTYLSGDYLPKQRNIYKMAKALNVSEAWLMGEDVPISRVTVNFEAVSGIAADISLIQYTGPIAAHFDATPNEEHEYKAVPHEWLGHRKPDDFFLATVDGNSMYPHYHDGDEIFCLRCSDMGYSGRVGILVFGDGEATLKKIEYEPGKNWIDLVPFNPEYTTKRIEDADLEQCRVVGRVLRVIRTVDSL